MRVRGPWTPSTRCSSMSLVADGPLMNVSGRVGSSLDSSSGTVSTTWSERTTQTWRSGTRLIARRPWSGEPSSTIVPVRAQAAAHAVTTVSNPLSSAGEKEASTVPPATVNPDGTTTRPSTRDATVSSTADGGHRCTDAL